MFTFDEVKNSVSSFVGSVGDGVSSAVETAGGIIGDVLSFDGANPLDAIGTAGASGGTQMMQYPETLGAGASNVAYESNPEKDDSWMSHTPDAGADAIISSKSSDPFISFGFKQISVTMDDVAKHKFQSTGLVKGLIVSKGSATFVNKAFGGNAAPGDKGILDKVTGAGANMVAIGYIANSVAHMAKTIDKKPVRETTARVALYMPPSIQIGDSATWAPQSNKALAYAGEISNKLRNSDGDITIGSAGKALANADFGGDVGIGMAASVGETLMGGGLIGAAASQLGFSDMALMASMGEMISLVGDEELRLLGKAINPNDYSQFQSVGLRQFSLSFKFLPDSPSESTEVENIIKQFRKSMYPIKHTNITMTVPDILDIKFHNVAGMVQLPEVALTNVNITYNPNSASFFKHSGQPVEISMDIQLQEIHPIHRDLVEEGY